MPIKLHRRDFLKLSLLASGLTLAGIGLFSRITKKTLTPIRGALVGANSKIGHLLRFGSFLSPKESQTVDTVIVGAGMAGLSAAWWLQKHKHENFILLELDQEVGGNSRSGSNGKASYPWGAHYVPIPGDEAVYVKELFRELGIIKGEVNGSPVYEEYYLCSDPHERLFFQGRWHDGLIPSHGLTELEKKELKEFFAHMDGMKEKRGKDGKRAFSIPVDLSSADPELRELDKISMGEWMQQQGWSTKPLFWYVNYCCRDDYGQAADQVSAWAGHHYFASRAGRAQNADPQTVITWPEGNGWLVKKLKAMFPKQILTDALVYSVIQKKNSKEVLVDYHPVGSGVTKRLIAKNVIYAGPRFTAKYVVKHETLRLHEFELPTAPWVIANITLSQAPAGNGQELAWDNVSYYSKSLGYIVSNHQELRSVKGETVITYYLPLTDKSPSEERKDAFTKDYAHWAKIVQDDLAKMHPGILDTILQLDVWVWGHGLVGPGIGKLWSPERAKMKDSLGNIHFAHTDQSGISIFEEAQYRGVEAAKKVLGAKT